jgi:hypothetical protein
MSGVLGKWSCLERADNAAGDAGKQPGDTGAPRKAAASLRADHPDGCDDAVLSEYGSGDGHVAGNDLADRPGDPARE